VGWVADEMDEQMATMSEGATRRFFDRSPTSPFGDNIQDMRRATVTIPDDLARQIDDLAASQPAPPSLTSIVQAALRRFLADPDATHHDGSLIDRVLSHRSTIRDVAARHGASNVRLFGSVARGEAGIQSDIDLLVSLEPGRSLFDIARLRAELEQILDAPIDLVADAGLTDKAADAILAETLAL
jgi:hypothetical protein